MLTKMLDRTRSRSRDLVRDTVTIGLLLGIYGRTDAASRGERAEHANTQFYE